MTGVQRRANTPGQGYDVLRAEVHRKALANIAYEMGMTLVRTSGSPVVTEAKDLSCSVLDENVEQIGFSSFVGLHISTAVLGVEAVLARHDKSEFRRANAYAVNDPHTAGALHQGDLGLVMPYFFEDELVGWGFANEHVLDIGGSAVSGFAPQATDSYSEALRFSGSRIMNQGTFDPEWLLFLETNVRAPVPVLNDLRSMAAGLHFGQRRLEEIIREYGLEEHRKFCEINKQLSEEMVRGRVHLLPDGEYSSRDWVEYDGHGEPWLLEIGCQITIDGDQLTLRFDGHEQVDAPVNTARPAILGQTMSTLQNMLFYDVPANAGLWRAIEFDLGEPGTLVNSVPPAAVSFGHVATGMRIDKVVRDALSQAISLSPDAGIRARVASQASEGDFLTSLTGVERRTGATTVIFPLAPVVGLGGPAQTVADGLDTYSNSANLGMGMTSVEIEEASAPMLVLWRRIAPSTGGAGMSRGGQGMSTAFRIVGADKMTGMASNSCSEVPTRGAGGGLPGAATTYTILSETAYTDLVDAGQLPTAETIGGVVKQLPAYTTVSLVEGEVFHIVSGGGGGLGDPLLRAPERVAKDLSDGYISTKVAQSLYGVEVDEAGRADLARTEQLRLRIREGRLGYAPRCSPRPLQELEVGISIRIADNDWVCAYCDSHLGARAGNYREACVSSRLTASEALRPYGMAVRERPAGDDQLYVLTHYCPECGSNVRTDVVLGERAVPDAPRLIHAGRG